VVLQAIINNKQFNNKKSFQNSNVHIASYEQSDFHSFFVFHSL